MIVYKTIYFASWLRRSCFSRCDQLSTSRAIASETSVIIVPMKRSEFCNRALVSFRSVVGIGTTNALWEG